MPILQKAQDIYGYLPFEVQKMISDETGIPLEKIYALQLFIRSFTMTPKGKYRISVCLGTACYVKGSGDIYNALMEKLGIVAASVRRTEILTGCLPVCGRVRPRAGHDGSTMKFTGALPWTISMTSCKIRIAHDAGNLPEHPGRG